MKLLLFFTYKVSLNDWLYSGIFSREVLLYKKLSDQGVDVTFITYDYEDLNHELNKYGIKHIPLYSNKNKIINNSILFSSIKFLIKNKKIIKDSNFLKTNQLSGSWLALLTKLLYRKPLYVRTGFDLLEFSIRNKKNSIKILIYYLLTQICLLYADAYSVTSKSDKMKLENKFFTKKITIRPNWIDTNNSYETIDNKIENFISVGRLEKQKGFENFIISIKNSNLNYHIYGDGSLKTTLIETAKKNNVNLKVFGRVPNERLLEIYKKYRFFINPSYFEGNPKALLEAMSRGCIVFASNINNHQEIIEHGKNGFLFDFENNDFLEFFCELKSDIKLLESVSKNAYNYVSEHNSLQNYLIEEVNEYKNLLQN